MAFANRSGGTVRYDGIYQCVFPTCSSYLRFFPDGRVVATDSTAGPMEISRQLNHEFQNRGLYQVKGSSIEFEIRSTGGAVNYIGNIVNGKLAVTAYSKTDYSVSNSEFTFIPIQGLYVEPQVSTPSYSQSSYRSSSSSDRGDLIRSIVCMACGIGSIVLSSSYGIGIIPAIASIVLNVMCRSKGVNNGFIRAGTITSAIGMIISVIMGLVTCSALAISSSYR